MKPSITEKNFGLYENKSVTEYTLVNARGLKIAVMNYGATLTRIIAPDRNGTPGNVILGFDDLQGYLDHSNMYMGSIVGRYCNRIGNAAFSLNGKTYRLAANNGINNLHGGLKGFDKAWWHAEKNEQDNTITFTYRSIDGEEGFPGNLDTTVVYRLDNDNRVTIEYSATTDKATPVNLTSHCYFNLSAGKAADILEHDLYIAATAYTAVDTDLVPTGEISPVINTALDFSIPKRIGRDINLLPDGYDHNFVLEEERKQAAVAYDSLTGRLMEMFTTEPGLQFYSTNFNFPSPADPTVEVKHRALCLEAQHFPDSPNKPGFPGTILHPGEKYSQVTSYRFSAR